MLEDTQNVEVIDAEVEFEKKPIEYILKEAKEIDTKEAAKEILKWIDNNIENFVDSQSKLYKLDLVIDDAESMPLIKKLQDLYRAIPDDDLEGTPLIKGLRGDAEAISNAMKNERVMEEGSKCRRELDKITEQVYQEICSLKETLEKLFGRLAYYYEKIIPKAGNREKALKIDEELKVLILEKEEVEGEKKKEEIQKKITKKIKEGEDLVKFEELEGALKITKFDYEAFSVGVKIAAPDIEVRGNTEKKVVKQYTIPEGFTIWLELAYQNKQRPVSMF